MLADWQCSYSTSSLIFCSDRQDEETEYATLPEPEAIPAITAVLCNSELFQALVQWLMLGATEASEPSNSGEGVSRKRSMSIGEQQQNPSKVMKLHHSPLPSVGRGKVGPGACGMDKLSAPMPFWNMSVLAATILYTALRPFDHWPVPLVKAYCDDCFAGRKWVDLKECQMLVQNLALVHSDIEEKEIASSCLEDAALMAAACRTYMNGSHRSFERQPQVSRYPSSVSSVGSNSVRPAATDSSDARVANVKSDSSSGEEEDDYEEKVILKEAVDNSSSNGPFPFQQRILRLEAVRQRYFGSNLELAHQSLVTSLSNRLDSRSKQSSGLLTALPSFMTVPGVRRLSAEHLEKWLQTPAVRDFIIQFIHLSLYVDSRSFG